MACSRMKGDGDGTAFNFDERRSGLLTVANSVGKGGSTSWECLFGLLISHFPAGSPSTSKSMWHSRSFGLINSYFICELAGALVISF